MIGDIWLNLPVKSIAKATDFFVHLGFSLNANQSDGKTRACFAIGKKNVVVMLFAEELFQKFTRSNIADAAQSAEILVSIGVESRQEVDDLAQKVVEAGGVLFSAPAESQGWLYGCGFSDLDGHRWNVLFMDMSRLPS